MAAHGGPPQQAPVPTRHGQDRDAARRMSRRLRMLVPEVGEPDEASWQAMGQALNRGDPLADAVADWLLDQGGFRVWPRVEAWVKAGPGGLQDAPKPVRDFVLATWHTPSWADPQACDAGARAVHTTGVHGMFVLRDAGLMAGYQAGAVNQTLLATGALHQGAQPRVARTTAWWMAVTEEGGMRLGAPGHLKTLNVRLMHAMVRRRLLRGGQWDSARWGLPVNQLDMQVTYLAFSIVHVLSLGATGMWMPQAQRTQVMALWRLIAWHMGVEEGLLRATEANARQALVHNLLTQAGPDDSSRLLARALHDEPLGRHYANLPGLRGRLNRARHLSQVSWLVGSEGLKNLGLPWSWPWYSLACLLPHGLRALALAASPGLSAQAARRGRARQRAYLQVMSGPA